MSDSWRQLVAEAPELAQTVRDRFGANLHHVLGTIRPDGSVRLSGTEVQVTDDGIGIGMMPDAHKLADVRRDARVEIHSAPLEEDLALGDVKVGGVLEEAGRPDGIPGVLFSLRLDRVSHVRVDGDELEFTTWSPVDGLRRSRRR